MRDFVPIPYGQRGGVCVPPKDDCHLIYRPRKPRASSLYPLFDSHYETVKAVWEERFERQYGFWRGGFDVPFQRCSDPSSCVSESCWVI